jgi:hypothetical protein
MFWLAPKDATELLAVTEALLVDADRPVGVFPPI